MGREIPFGRGREHRGDRSRRIDSSRPRADPDRRGQTNVVGIVLLVGFVVVGSVGIAVVGSIALEMQRSAVETEHARNSMLAFAHAAETAAFDDGDAAAVGVETFDHGRVEHRNDGRVQVVRVNDSAVLYEESLGSLAYVTDDAEIAYQGGGLWRSDGDATVSLSSPPVERRDGRLAFSIVHLAGEPFRSDSFEGTVRRPSPPTGVDIGPAGDAPAGRTVAAGTTVRVEIASAYCDGWERELEETIPERIVERCSDGRDDRVRVELEVPPRIDGVDGAVIADEIDVHQSAPPIEGDVRAGSVDEEKVNGTVYGDGYEYASVDDRIDAAIDECEGAFEELDREVSEPGLHCTDEITDTHEFDATDGAITVVVRGSIGDPNYQDDLRVEGDNPVTILVAGDLHARGNAAIGTEADPSRLRLLFSSDSDVTTARGGPTLAALVYAPDSTVSFRGNPTLEGSVVGERVEIDDIDPGRVAYHESIGGVAFRPGVGTPLRSVDVTAYELALEE